MQFYFGKTLSDRELKSAGEYARDRVKATLKPVIKETPKPDKVIYSDKNKVITDSPTGEKTYYNDQNSRDAVRRGDLDNNKVIYNGKSMNFGEYRRKYGKAN
jgi:hypothetical protein